MLPASRYQALARVRHKHISQHLPAILVCYLLKGVVKVWTWRVKTIIPTGLKLSAIIVVKIRQIAVGVIRLVFQTEFLLKKYCVFILL